MLPWAFLVAMYVFHLTQVMSRPTVIHFVDKFRRNMTGFSMSMKHILLTSPLNPIFLGLHIMPVSCFHPGYFHQLMHCPLFSDETCSPAMKHHCLHVIGAAIPHVNPNQVPVICLDQPRYALAKQIQWLIPGDYGEDKYIILLGGLHIELTAFKALGHWLEGSGWVESLQEANIAAAGVAESFLKASHIARSRHAREVTACTLHILMQESFANYMSNNIDDDPPVNFEEWCAEWKAESPQFLYWFTYLELELLVLLFLHSLRTGNFKMYLDCITKLAPWFFSLNHNNYARWLSVHIRDMCSLEAAHP